MSDAPGRIIHKDYWNDHLVEIIDNGDHRSLYFGSGHLQSRMSLSRPHDLTLSYTWYMLTSLLIQPLPKNILIIGIGAGSFVRFFHHHFPHCRIDAVDYSQHIINVARGYFYLPEKHRVTVHCQDGFRYLQETCDSKYDLILVDAFDGQGMAPTIYAAPFFSLCQKHLSGEGIISCNLWSNDMARYREIKTILADRFAGCLAIPVPERGNIIALAMPFAVPWPRIYQKSRALADLTKRYGINFKKLASVAKQNNLSLTERFVASFS